MKPISEVIEELKLEQEEEHEQMEDYFCGYSFKKGAQSILDHLASVGVEGLAQLWLKPRFVSDYYGNKFSGYDVVKGSMLDDADQTYHLVEAIPALAKIAKLEEEVDKYFKLHDAAAGEVEILRAEIIEARHNEQGAKVMLENANKKIENLQKQITLLEQSNEFYASSGVYMFDEEDEDTEQLDLMKPWRHTSGKLARSIKAQVEAIKKGGNNERE